MHILHYLFIFACKAETFAYDFYWIYVFFRIWFLLDLFIFSHVIFTGFIYFRVWFLPDLFIFACDFYRISLFSRVIVTSHSFPRAILTFHFCSLMIFHASFTFTGVFT